MSPDDLLWKEEVYRVVGAAMEVLNEGGRGLHDKPCETGWLPNLG